MDISNMVKDPHAKKDWTREQLARVIGSSQPSIAILESCNPGITLELMIKALLRLGTSEKVIDKLLWRELEKGKF